MTRSTGTAGVTDDITDMTTRHPDEDEENSRGDEELTNGKPATERNVSNLLDDLQDDYEQGVTPGMRMTSTPPTSWARL